MFQMRHNPFPLLILIFLALLFLPVIASGFQVMGNLANGPSFDVVEANGYLYAAQGGEVRVYDVSTAAKIQVLTWKDYVSRIYVSGGQVRGLYYESGYLYIGSEGKFAIADIRQPDNPVMVATVNSPYSRGLIRDVEVKGNYAYLTISGQGVQVVDISDKTNPKFVNLVKLTGTNSPWRVSSEGNFLYVVSERDNRLDIFDLTNPGNPTKVGDFTLGMGKDGYSGVAVKGDYAFVTEYHNGFRVIDISNPASPFQVANLSGMNANDVKIQDNYAYVSVRYQGFNIIDISNPQKPVIVGKGTGIAGYDEGIYPAANGYTYLAGESMGVGIYNTATIASPKLVTKVMLIGGADSVAAKDNYLYIGAHNDGIWVVDVKDPANPKEVAFVNNRGRNSGAAIQGNYLYVAGAWSGLNVIDITNPEQPNMVVFDYSDSIGAVLPDGKYLYTSTGIIDIANPLQPNYIARNAYFEGNFAKFGQDYILVAATYTHPGLHIIDVRNKVSPVVVATYSAGKGFQDVAVEGNTVIALSGNDIIAIDISDVTKPTQLSKVSYGGVWSGRSIDIDSATGIAYVAGGASDQIKAVDITTPTQIKEIDKIELSPTTYYSGIDYYDERVYTCEKSGMFILSLKPGTDTPPPVQVTQGLNKASGVTSSTNESSKAFSNKKIILKNIPLEYAPWICLIYCIMFLRKSSKI